MMSEVIFGMVEKYKSRASHCKLTDKKCLAAGARSNMPTPHNFERVCRKDCPWGMTKCGRRA